MATNEQHTGPLAAHALGQASASAAEPWSDRTTASHWRDGQEWAVIVDWAVRSDGTRVPASVTLSSLGATLGETPMKDAEPAAVVRALVDSIAWGSVIAGSRASLAGMPGISGDWEAFRQYEPTPAQRARESRKGSTPTDRHDEVLRLTADIYKEEGGEEMRGIARLVHAKLVLRGVQPMRRGPAPEPDPVLAADESMLSEVTVRRWIKEARKRGYIDPSTRRKSGPKTPDPTPGRGPIDDRKRERP